MSRAFSDFTNIAIEYESAFTGVRKTVNASEEEFKSLEGSLKSLAGETGITFVELSKIGELGGQLGVGIEDLDKFTETVAKLGATTNLSVEEAATSFARIANVTGEPLSKIDKLGSVVVELGNNFATTEAEIVAITQRLSSAGTVAGVASQDLFAIGTALTSVGIQSEAGGTAVSRALLDINKAVQQ